MDPERKVCVERGVEIGVMKRDRPISVACNTDGLTTTMHGRQVGEIPGGITPILKTIDEAVGVDDQRGLGQSTHSHAKRDGN